MVQIPNNQTIIESNKKIYNHIKLLFVVWGGGGQFINGVVI